MRTSYMRTTKGIAVLALFAVSVFALPVSAKEVEKNVQFGVKKAVIVKEISPKAVSGKEVKDIKEIPKKTEVSKEKSAARDIQQVLVKEAKKAFPVKGPTGTVKTEPSALELRNTQKNVPVVQVWRQNVIEYLNQIMNISLVRVHERGLRVSAMLDQMPPDGKNVALMRVDLNRINGFLRKLNSEIESTRHRVANPTLSSADMTAMRTYLNDINADLHEVNRIYMRMGYAMNQMK